MPKIVKCTDLSGSIVSESGSKDLVFRTVFQKEDKLKMSANYNDILPGGNSKDHFHSDEHIVFVVKGKGRLDCGSDSYEVSEGTAIYLASNEPHCYHNTGEEKMVLFGILCKVD